MESIANKARQKGLLDDHASSVRKRTMICLRIFFIVLFTVIILSIISVFLAIKQEAEHESLSASDSEEIIRVICDLTEFPRSCFRPLLIRIHRNITADDDSGKRIKITPSTIFSLSLSAAFDELNIVDSSSKRSISQVKNSTILTDLQATAVSVRDSAALVHKALAVISVDEHDDDGDETLRNPTRRSDLEKWISAALEILDSRLTPLLEDGFEGLDLKKKVDKAREFVVNCSDILGQMDRIIAMLKPPSFLTIEDCRNFLLSSLEFGYGSLFPIFFYSSQYLILVVFICIMLRQIL